MSIFVPHSMVCRAVCPCVRVFRLAAICCVVLALPSACEAGLEAGAAMVDITDYESGPANDVLYAKALVLKSGDTTAVIATVDAVAIEEIGPIKNGYLDKVRAQLEEELQIVPSNVIVNASHCHGIVVADVAERTVQAVREAAEKLAPVKIGVGVGHEDRVSANRRLMLKSGRELDVRHAYSLPPDEEVASVGPIDPQIGVLRLDGEDGNTVAVVYNFAVHPIQGAAGGGNTADIIGYSSKVIEENTGEGTVALFLQGCAGDINPAFYKDVDHPRDAEPLGNYLGLSTLKAYRAIEPREDDRLVILNETRELPRADFAQRIADMEAERDRLLGTLGGTSMNLKTFLSTVTKYSLADEFPSYYSHRYLHEEMLGRDHLKRLDAENLRNMERYVQNIYTMEELSRVQTNLRLLRKNQAKNVAAGKRTIDVELTAWRIGDFVLTTFPGELVVRIGLNIKEASPHERTFVAGYTNGYIYYAPTTEQALNAGAAQEDSDCLLAPEWQPLYEEYAAELLKRL